MNFQEKCYNYSTCKSILAGEAVLGNSLQKRKILSILVRGDIFLIGKLDRTLKKIVTFNTFENFFSY